MFDDFVAKEYWTEETNSCNFTYRTKKSTDPIYKLIQQYVPVAKEGKECIELGSYPGSYICLLGELGYKISGIDIHPENSKSLKQYLESQYNVGDFYSEDIFDFKFKKKYDFVCSFGLIEHFKDFLDVIEIHNKIVQNGGTIIITTPNYRGFFQRIIYKYFYPKDYSIHNINSMRPDLWATFLRKKGYKIIYSGYCGGMKYWINPYNRNFFVKTFLRIWIRIANFVNKTIWFESKHFSQHCAIVAVKGE